MPKSITRILTPAGISATRREVSDDLPALFPGDHASWVVPPDAARLPVLVSVPHAGRDYPRALVERLRVPPAALMRLEDRHVDLLARSAAQRGCAVLVMRRPRAWIDLNRRPDEIDPDMIVDTPRSAFVQPSLKVRGGLGLIPRRLADTGDLWRGGFLRSEIDARVAQDHQPYHRALGDGLQRIRRRYGGAVLVDLHSMPPLRSGEGNDPPGIVLGDRFGQSAASWVSDCAFATLSGLGYRVAVNHPYAGGYILQRHGAPSGLIHALQVEIDRSLYLDQALREPAATLATLDRHIGLLVEALSDALGAGEGLAAAE